MEWLEDRTAPAVFTVTNTGDNGGVNPAPFAGTGTLRQAIIDANATSGADSITFAIPDALKSPGGWWTIQPLALLPTLTDPVSIDGWSQAGAGPGLAPMVMLDGSNLAGVGLHVRADGCMIRGLSIGNFLGPGPAINLHAYSTTVQGCYVGVDPTGNTAVGNGVGIADNGFGEAYTVIGGANPGEGNVISGNAIGIGIGIYGEGGGATIRGNRIGTNAAGTAALPNVVAGIRVSSPWASVPATVGGSGPGEGNLISGNGQDGIDVGSNVRILGNLIGTDVTGMHALGNAWDGIYSPNVTTNVVIGGTDPGSRNVISSNGRRGIEIQGVSAGGDTIQGNWIGTDVNGAPTLGNGEGITAGSNWLIGGTAAGAGNLIAGNLAEGIGLYGSNNQVMGNTIYDNGDTGVGSAGINNQFIGNVIHDNRGAGIQINGGPPANLPANSYAQSNTVSANSIYANGGLGIDLQPTDPITGNLVMGVTLNDSMGHDGPNHFQNFPVLTSVTVHAGGSSTVTGTFTEAAEPNTTLRLEFFANHAADPTGYGQGQRYIGSVNVTTDATGNARDANGNLGFTAPLAALLSGEQILSATATNLATGDTSEFCQDISVPSVGPITAPLAPVALHTAVNTSASFTDPFTTTTHTALWDWGDGTTSAGGVTESNGSGTVAGSHTYAADGVYTVTLSVTNNGGGSAQSVFNYVVVYNPSAGFTTGGGWFTSPAGAYAANPSLTGRADFGLNAKYKAGSTVPTGNTEFQFPAAGLNFHATSYDWLVITTNQAQYQGSGTINGAGAYGFLVTAQDNGGTTPDLVRVKIWDKNNNNAVVYDTQPGVPANAAPTTPLGGGRIQVHTNAQLAAGGAGTGGAAPAPLTAAELRPIVQEAIARWQEAGISPAQASALSQVTVGIAEFPGPWLGMAFPGSIWIDQTAAGYGWYIDPTPADDSEFPAAPGGPAYGKMDLLTVVEHELGHELGYADTAGSGLMGVFLAPGIRRVPAPAHPAGLADGPVQGTRAVVALPGLGSNGAGAAVGSPGAVPAAAVDRLFAGYAGEDATLAALLLGDQGDGPAQGPTGYLRRRT
jgi:PKD repeat protein